MKLDRVTITGADDKVNPDDLHKIQQKYPFVEWGILFSKNREGQPRYPTRHWVQMMLTWYSDLKLSAHLCGEYAKECVNGDYSFLNKLHNSFSRVQINFNFKDLPSHSIHNLAAKSAVSEKSAFILQANQSNTHIINHAIQLLGFNCHLLYDSSGGRGKETIDTSLLPFKTYTGYAGGISTDNIKDVCQGLLANKKSNETVWIDLESGVRTNNEFDLNKVVKILESAYPFITVKEGQKYSNIFQ